VASPGTASTAAAVTATLALAGSSWFAAIEQMRGMSMGVSTELGSFAFFLGVWVSMMAAMMLPAAVPAVVLRVRAAGRMRVVPLFAGSYLVVWAVVGLPVYFSYRPHGTAAAGALTVAAGLYELTPLKRHCRRRCRDSVGSGLRFGFYCFGSSIGLMVMLIALGVMSVAWMSVVAVLVSAQKLLPPRASIDVPVALTIIGLGILIMLAPGALGLTTI
jgi:predicted metal-binding membrane protein